MRTIRKPGMPVARKIVLQLAVRDIGQLTDFEPARPASWSCTSQPPQPIPVIAKDSLLQGVAESSRSWKPGGAAGRPPGMFTPYPQSTAKPGFTAQTKREAHGAPGTTPAPPHAAWRHAGGPGPPAKAMPNRDRGLWPRRRLPRTIACMDEANLRRGAPWRLAVWGLRVSPRLRPAGTWVLRAAAAIPPQPPRRQQQPRTPKNTQEQLARLLRTRRSAGRRSAWPGWPRRLRC